MLTLTYGCGSTTGPTINSSEGKVNECVGLPASSYKNQHDWRHGKTRRLLSEAEGKDNDVVDLRSAVVVDKCLKLRYQCISCFISQLNEFVRLCEAFGLKKFD